MHTLRQGVSCSGCAMGCCACSPVTLRLPPIHQGVLEQPIQTLRQWDSYSGWTMGRCGCSLVAFWATRHQIIECDLEPPRSQSTIVRKWAVQRLRQGFSCSGCTTGCCDCSPMLFSIHVGQKYLQQMSAIYCLS